MDLTLLSIIAPAFVASLLVMATHVPLGTEVLNRGIIFIDLATAQLAGLGAVAGTLYFGPEHEGGSAVAVQASALAAALAGGAIFSWTDKKLHQYQEALIGCTFVLAASMALLLLANQPAGGDEIRDLLAGQILWVSWREIATILPVYIAILVVWFFFRERLGRLGFYGIFTVAVTASVQIVGVYLVFASLIFPALAARVLVSRHRIIAGYVISVVGIILGLVFSVLTDAPTGPTLVWSLAFAALLAAIIFSRFRPENR